MGRPTLTPREAEVCDLIRRGKADKEIAVVLGLSTRTARFHVANILRKFNVSRRGELIAMATGRELHATDPSASSSLAINISRGFLRRPGQKASSQKRDVALQ
jgi:DNA-binding CsgD family transcriptional regulator